MVCLRDESLLGLALCLAVLCGGASAHADDLLGAESALEQWRDATATGDTQAEPSEADPLRSDLDAFTEAWPTLSDDAAATGWLALYSRWGEASASPSSRGGFTGFGGFGGGGGEDPEQIAMLDMIRAIPGPAVWPTLKQQVEARPHGSAKASERALRLLVFYLNADETNFQNEAEMALNAAGKKDEYLKQNLLEAIAPLMQIQREEGGADTFRESINQAKASPDSFYRFEVPDLVTLYGEDDARALLEEIVILRVDLIEIEVGDATRRLATQVAAEKIDELTKPRWELVSTVDQHSVALYEALENKFAKKATPPNEPSNGGLVDLLKQMTGVGGSQSYGYDPYGGEASWQQRQARAIYLLGLIVTDRIDEAAAFVEEHYTDGEEVRLPWGLMETLQRSGVVRPLFDFTEQMIQTDAGDALWPMYIKLGAQLELSDQVLAKVEAALANTQGEQRLSLLDHLVSARLAADDVERGIQALREKIKVSLDEEGDSNTAEYTGYARMARIGQLMGREDWLNEGLKGAIAALQKPSDPEGRSPWGRESARGTVVKVLMGADRLGEAEALLIDAVKRSVTQYKREKQNGGYARLDAVTDAMVDLTVLYGEAERWGDVLTLLDDSPYWGTDDLLAIQDETASSGETPLVVYVARALSAIGQTQRAWDMASIALNDMPGEDALYGILVSLDPPAALARLDELFARDQFEERPLIWKAKLQFEGGEIEAAHTTIRQAISIDPSDGEQGPGDRMRAYAVLAEVLRAQGDAETAEVMEGAVRAIRMSEEADEFDRAGLLSRAVTMYKDALTHFADAYCIQSRLAIQLANLGRYDEAAEHYKRAYELMPDSFGRVESHCFGCEGAFEGERAQTIAERVFDELVIANPFKPQVHYLRGYLNAAQGQDQEALENYREAVRLDADYLNAWTKIQRMASRMQIDRDQRDLVALEIFRLDPLGRHSSADLSSVGNLTAVWNAVEAAQPLRVEHPDSIWALPVSAAWIKESSDPREGLWLNQNADPDDELPTPGGFLAEHGITRAAALIAALGG